MKTKRYCLIWIKRGIIEWLCLCLVMLSVPAFSDPPQDRGRGASEHQNNGNGNGQEGSSHQNNGNGNGNGNGQEVASHERGSNAHSLGRSEIARANLAKHVEARDRKDLDFREQGNNEPENFERDSGTKSEPSYGHRYAFEKNENTRLTHDFEQALRKLENKNHARWFYNPKDDRPQGNQSKLEMLDPYGHSFDDRLALYGNRGRPIRNSPEPEPEPVPSPTPEPTPDPVPEPSPQPLPTEEPTYLTVTSDTLEAWQYTTYGWLYYPIVTFEQLGYTQTEADFLKSLSYDAILKAVSDGQILLP